jgi:ribosomal protein L33
VNRKKLWFLVLSVIILVSFISGCIGGGQFGAPSADSTVTIKGVVVAPDNDCFTDTCSNPSIIEGEPLPNADIVLKGNNGQTLTGKTDCAGNYQISGLTDEGYILYANRGEVWIKKALSPVTGDGGEANYITTAQVILWEVIENTNPGAIAIKDIPTAIPFDAIPQEFIDAVKAALADCRDAQQDPTCLALAKNIAVANFGAPCGCIEVTPTPTPTPGCPVGVAVAKISISDLGGLNRRFDASGSIPQTGQYKIKSFAWKISDGEGVIYESSQKIFDYPLPGLGNYSVSLAVTTPCEDASTSQNFQILPTKLTVKKVLAPGSDPGGPWAFNLTGPGINQNFDLAAGGQEVFSSLAPGQYTLTEDPGTFQCVSITVNGTPDPTPGDGSVIFNLTSGAEVTVIYTNNKTSQPAKLTVVKVLDTETPSPATPWEFKLTGPNNYSATFNLPDNGNWSKAFETLEPGEYTIQETQQTGYVCTDIEVSIPATIDLANRKATFTLASEANVTATFTNKKQEEKPAKLTVKKLVANGDTSSDSWEFSLTGYPSFLLKHSETKEFDPIDPGTYTITETQINGYECSIEVSGNGVTSVIENGCSVTFTLLSAADVTVIYTNRKNPQNVQDILIVGPILPPNASFGKIRVSASTTSYMKVEYKLEEEINYSVPYEAWCIDKQGFVTPGEYYVNFHTADNSNPSIGNLIERVWGVINLGKWVGYSVESIQNEIWFITNNFGEHNPSYDNINPKIENGIVCF